MEESCTADRLEKATLTSQHNLETKGHVTKLEAQAAQLQAAQQLASSQELTIAGLKATLAAKEEAESQRFLLDKELEKCRYEQKRTQEKLTETQVEAAFMREQQLELQAEKEVSCQYYNTRESRCMNL
jgi:uncharacterized protein (DUF342 family)